MKGRPSDNPLICHIAAMEQLPLLVREIPGEVLKLAEKFWPGPLTFVLKKQANISNVVTAGLDTVAVRMPRHPVALELIRSLGSPIAAPSANLSGKPSSSRVEHVLTDFAGMEGGVIDGGEVEIGLESTVLWLAEGKPQILRPGSVRAEEIGEVLGCKVECGKNFASPGMRHKHYAPRARVRLVESFEGTGNDSFLMSTEAREGFYEVTPRNLYALLRQADEMGAAEIVVMCTGKAWEDLAFRDRLTRSALR